MTLTSGRDLDDLIQDCSPGAWSKLLIALFCVTLHSCSYGHRIGPWRKNLRLSFVAQRKKTSTIVPICDDVHLLISVTAVAQRLLRPEN